MPDSLIDTTTIEFAESLIEAEPWTPTPLLQAHAIGERLDADVWLKREDCTPIGSFKLRGAITTAGALADRTCPPRVSTSRPPGTTVWRSSTPAHGTASRLTVVAPEGATPSKLDRIRLLGGTVEIHGSRFRRGEGVREREGPMMQAASSGRTVSSRRWRPERRHHRDGVAAATRSRGTRSSFRWETDRSSRVLPKRLKRRSPDTRIVGVVPDGAPSMAQALRGQDWDESAPVNTLADGLAVRVPDSQDRGGAYRVSSTTLWTVSESDILSAVKTLMELEQVLAEPSAATPVAAMGRPPGRDSGEAGSLPSSAAPTLSMSLLPQLATTKGTALSMKEIRNIAVVWGGADGTQHRAGVRRLRVPRFR